MQKLTTPHALAICPLYQIVFGHRLTKTVVLTLVLMIGIHPIAPVFADTEGDTAAAAVTEPTSDEIVTEIVNEEPPTAPAESLVMDDEPPTSDVGNSEDEATVEADVSDVDEENLAAEIHAVSTTTGQTNSDLVPQTATSTHSVNATSTTQVVGTSTITDLDTQPVVDAEESEAQATTSTTTPVAVIPPTNIVQTDDTYYQFSKDDCVRVADGSFYCGTGESDAPVLEDSFYVALDADGDSEIFARIDGETIQVTQNTVTDAAPYYDAISNTLVWHQDIKGRYQIMSYDFVTKKTSQLTSGRVNNMQPQRAGGITVWQQWGSESWDIVLHDGDSVTALTDDDVPDVNPSVRGDFVLWQTQYADQQTITIYDRTTGEQETVQNDDTDLSFSNPRLMLVFEGVNAAGDVVAKGYDPETGRLVPLTTTPAPLPDNIPDSEPTDEVRALPPKPASTEVEEDEEDRDTTATSTAAAVPTATTTEPTDIVIPPFATQATTTSVAATTTTPATAIPDLVIPPASTTDSQ